MYSCHAAGNLVTEERRSGIRCCDTMKQSDTTNTVIVVPAYNEEASIGALLAEIRQQVPGIGVVVVNDGSEDGTAAVARGAGATVLDLPCNLGVGGAVQTGFRYAYEKGYQFVLRCDGDGQHPPSEVPRLVSAMNTANVDMVIGSRFLGTNGYKSTFFRNCGITGLAFALSLICRQRVTDPTSGFQMLNRRIMYAFSRSYPVEYPEPEALALARRQGYEFLEVPVSFRERRAGQSSIVGWGTLYFALKVFLALVVDRTRPVDCRYAKFNMESNP